MCRKQFVPDAPRPSAWWWLAPALGLIVPFVAGLIAGGYVSW